MNIKEQIKELDRQIEILKAKKLELNPFANLKDLNNKTFGEQWSEPYICSKCPSFIQQDEKGWDLWNDKLGKIEVKSSRLPCAQITFNQCHPYDCDYFLFVEYDTECADVHIFLVPSKDFFQFGISVQHTRATKEKAECFTLSGSTRKNVELLEHYRIASWEELEKLAGG